MKSITPAPLIELLLASGQLPWAPAPQPGAGTRRSLGHLLCYIADACRGSGDPATFRVLLFHPHSEGFGSFFANVKTVSNKKPSGAWLRKSERGNAPFEKAFQ